MTDEPLVSVVMPAYNSAPFIGEAISSVLAQSHRRVEVIVVDDGSTDETADIVTAFGAPVLLLRQANQGAGAARNRGIAAARGDYVAFLDADDVWRHDKLQRQLDAMQRGGLRMCYSRFVWWRPGSDGRYGDAGGTLAAPAPAAISVGSIDTGWIYTELLLDCVVWTSTVIVEKQVLDEVGGFDESLRKGQDYDLWLRLSQSEQWLGIDEPLALYRINAGSITHSVKAVNYEYLILTRALSTWGPEGRGGQRLPDAVIAARLARSCASFGAAQLANGRPRLAAQSLWQAMRHDGPTARLVLRYAVARVRALLAPDRPS